MKNQVIIDNWSISEIKSAISNEHFYDKREPQKYHDETNYISSVTIKLKTLAVSLGDLVTRDKILIDTSVKTEWIGTTPYLDKLVEDEIIEFYTDSPDDERKANVQLILDSFGDREKVKNIINSESALLKEYWNYFSGMTVRTAEYLLSSSKLDAIYSPHHFRSNFLKRTIFPGYKDANLNLKQWIKAEREQIITKINEDEIIKVGTLHIDPFFILIVENSNSKEELIKVALQLRDDYKKFRSYLSKYQDALNKGALKDLLEHKRVLESVHNKVSKKDTPSKFGTFTISIGYGILKYSNNLPLFDELLFKVGIRSSLQKLILTHASDPAIDKFLKLFSLNPHIFRAELTKELAI